MWHHWRQRNDSRAEPSGATGWRAGRALTCKCGAGMRLRFLLCPFHSHPLPRALPPWAGHGGGGKGRHCICARRLARQ